MERVGFPPIIESQEPRRGLNGRMHPKLPRRTTFIACIRGGSPWQLFTRTSMNLESMSSFRLWWIFHHRDPSIEFSFFFFTIALFPSRSQFLQILPTDDNLSTYLREIVYRRIVSLFVLLFLRVSSYLWIFRLINGDRKILENGNPLGIEIIPDTRR